MDLGQRAGIAGALRQFERLMAQLKRSVWLAAMMGDQAPVGVKPGALA